MMIGEEEVLNERQLLTVEDGPMMASTASVNYLVIHCSATRCNRDYTAEQLLRDHKTWASAIIGLALGGGFYEGALLTTVLVLVAESFLSRLEYRILDHVPEINLYMEYTGKPCLEEVLRFLRENKVSLQDMEITRNSDSESHNACAIFSLRFSKGISVDELLTHVSQIEGVITVQEL